MESQDNSRDFGKKGEDVAAQYLTSKGYTIVKRNFHYGRHGELDIVAKKEDLLIFVEVRSKFSRNTINPMLTLNYPKIKKIKKSGEGYLYINKIRNVQCRFDFIWIDFSKNKDKPEVNHIENAF
ncbi:MAG: YraN family protein [Candidatus Kapaibacteriales bacterium]